MKPVEYLQQYYPFASDVLARVEEEVYRQEATTWPEYMKKNQIPALQKFTPRDGKPIEVLDIRPSDYEEVFLYHMPMGCLLDANTIMHVSSFAGTRPEARVISVSNPGQPGKGTAKLTLAKSLKVWQGDLRPTIAPTLEYLSKQKIESVLHIGVSYGADKAAASAENADKYDQTVPRAIMIEPTSVKKRSLPNMALTFLSTAKYAKQYGGAVPGDVFKDAQNYKESEILFAAGLARLSNIAIGHALGQTSFEVRVDRAMTLQPELRSAIAWGSQSEFAINGLVIALSSRLSDKYGRLRVEALRLEGQRHAMNVDPILNAAIALQAIKKMATAKDVV